jgi:uncharacterized protein (DUF2147 family)
MNFKTAVLGVLMAAGTFSGLAAQASGADAFTGTWQTPKAKVKIFKATNGKYYGNIVALNEPNDANGKPKKDIHNPDPKLRDRGLIGLQILRGFKYDGNNVWEDGRIYNPEDGKDYSCKITLKDGGKTLEVRGYIGISLIGKTQIWKRP